MAVLGGLAAEVSCRWVRQSRPAGTLTFVVRSLVGFSMLCVLLSLKAGVGESGNEWAVLE